MIRVSPELETLELDFDAADPFYAPNAKGKLTAWYVPSPGLLAWFRKTMAAAAASGKLTTNQLRELKRMQGAFAFLTEWEGLPIGDKPAAPHGQTAEQFAAVTKYVAGNNRVLTPQDPHGVSSSHNFPPRYFLAWRPMMEAEYAQSIAEGKARRGAVGGFIEEKPAVESTEFKVPKLKLFDPNTDIAPEPARKAGTKKPVSRPDPAEDDDIPF
jgi:hypothetical protein